MVILRIDTSDNTKTIVGLKTDQIDDTLVEETGYRKAQHVLRMVEGLLNKHALTPDSLTGVEVALGPGSFTGLRVGITIANTFASSLHLPINGGEPGKSVEPVYTVEK